MPFRADKTNNPLNLKGGGQWKGLTGTDSEGHNIFDTKVNGIRAGVRCIEVAIKAGRSTPKKLIEGWTATAADWPDYITFVVAHIGGRADSGIDFRDDLFNLVGAMSEFEQGAGYRDKTSDIYEAIAAHARDFLKD